MAEYKRGKLRNTVNGRRNTVNRLLPRQANHSPASAINPLAEQSELIYNGLHSVLSWGHPRVQSPKAQHEVISQRTPFSLQSRIGL